MRRQHEAQPTGQRLPWQPRAWVTTVLAGQGAGLDASGPSARIVVAKQEVGRNSAPIQVVRTFGPAVAGRWNPDHMAREHRADRAYRATAAPNTLSAHEGEWMRWLFAAFLVLQAHFAASYLVSLDVRPEGEFGGLLRWAWPWADGDGGRLGTVTTSSGFPVTGFFIAVTVAAHVVLVALAMLGIWVPFAWWWILAIGGAAMSLFLMVMFFGPTKLLPIAGDLVVL